MLAVLDNIPVVSKKKVKSLVIRKENEKPWLFTDNIIFLPGKHMIVNGKVLEVYELVWECVQIIPTDKTNSFHIPEQLLFRKPQLQ